MEDNVALGIRISVTVVLVASLVAIVLTLMVIGQSILGSGQNKLQSGLTQVQQQDLEQYANVTKKGSVVKATLNLYQGEPVALLVKTTALYKAGTSNGGDDPVPLGGAGGASTRYAAPIPGNGMYFNYGCLIAKPTNAGQFCGSAIPSSNTVDGTEHPYVIKAGTITNGVSGANDNVRLLKGNSYLEAALVIQNGIKQTNFDTAGTVSIGNMENILDNGLFYCQIIKDISGQIIGICFTQQA